MNSIVIAILRCIVIKIFDDNGEIGNREGKIFVWELHSSPPVLTARQASYSILKSHLLFLFYLNPLRYVS